MLFLEPLSEAVAYVRSLDQELIEKYGRRKMSATAIQWLAFVITGVVLTGTLCWRRFERSSSGSRTASSLSWMFRKSKRIPWESILTASTNMIIRTFNVTGGQLVYDDFDNHRSKKTSKIYGTHKVRNKKGGGFVDAQNLILLLLVTPTITLTVGFAFYRPDPVKKAWDKEDKRLKRNKIAKSQRPPMPAKNPKYPTKKELAARMLRKFKYRFSQLKIKAVMADNAYLSKQMRSECKRIFPNVQFISQLRSTQNITCPRRGSISLKKYFDGVASKTEVFNLRGGLRKKITYASARLMVNSHRHKYHVVAFKYEGENKFRFLAATDLFWHTRDIIGTYAWRWLVEVEIEDAQLFCGYGQLAMQQGEDGARRGMILSLLVNQFLLQHPIQQGLHRAHQPLATVGSLRNCLQLDSFRESIEKALESPDPKVFLKNWVDRVESLVELRPSRKHMCGHTAWEVKKSPSLIQKFSEAS